MKNKNVADVSSTSLSVFALSGTWNRRPISFSTSSRYLSRTGCMNPGTFTIGQPPKYCASLWLSPVALMRTTLRSGFSFRLVRSRASSRSVFMSLSWTSSTTTWLIPFRVGFDCSFLSRTPTVRKSNAPPLCSGSRLSSLTYRRKIIQILCITMEKITQPFISLRCYQPQFKGSVTKPMW